MIGRKRNLKMYVLDFVSNIDRSSSLGRSKIEVIIERTSSDSLLHQITRYIAHISKHAKTMIQTTKENVVVTNKLNNKNIH